MRHIADEGTCIQLWPEGTRFAGFVANSTVTEPSARFRQGCTIRHPVRGRKVDGRQTKDLGCHRVCHIPLPSGRDIPPFLPGRRSLRQDDHRRQDREHGIHPVPNNEGRCRLRYLGHESGLAPSYKSSGGRATSCTGKRVTGFDRKARDGRRTPSHSGRERSSPSFTSRSRTCRVRLTYMLYPHDRHAHTGQHR